MKEPLYKALAAELRREIRSGRLRPGDKLPSKRALAEEKKLSLMTVTGALELLEAEGCIRTEERRGYFVADTVKPMLLPDPPPEPERGAESGFLYDFKSSHTAVEGFPFYTWAKLMRETLSEKDDRLLAAIDPKGVYELRAEIAKQLGLMRGIVCEPRQVVVGAGGPLTARRPDRAGGVQVIHRFGDHGLPADDAVGVGGLHLWGKEFLCQGPHQQQGDHRHHDEQGDLQPHRRAHAAGDQRGQAACGEPDRRKAHSGGLDHGKENQGDQPKDAHETITSFPSARLSVDILILPYHRLKFQRNTLWKD